MSQHHKEFPGGEQLKDETHGKYLEADHSPDHEHVAANEEGNEGEASEQVHDDNEAAEESELIRASITRPAPPPPVPNMSTRPVSIHHKGGSESSSTRSLPTSRALPSAPDSEVRPENQEAVVPPRPSRRSIPLPPAPIHEGT
jgi:hypothetical protein